MRKKLRETISELAAILEAEDIDEIELRRWWMTVRVTRRRRDAGTEPSASGDEISAVVDAAGETGSEEAQSPAERTPPVTGSAESPIGAGERTGINTIVSPMVGTFYRASAPDSEPFVSVGDRVEVGEILCIIEAMKLMNEIEADRSGIIKEVLVHDSQPVEFGQPLFLVESA